MKSMDSELAAIMTNRRKQELDCDVEISPMKGGGRETFVAGLREQIIESAKSRRSSSWSEHPAFADRVEEKQVSRGGDAYERETDFYQLGIGPCDTPFDKTPQGTSFEGLLVLQEEREARLKAEMERLS
jgi:hypothetical protein